MDPGVTGGHGQGPRTPGGEELVDFAASHVLRIMGTYFPKPAGRGTTWHSLANQTGYALDHVLTRSRDACMVIDVEPKSLPEIHSDHRCVVATVNPRRGQGGAVRRGLRAAQRARAAGRHNVAQLNSEAKAAAFSAAVTEAVADAPRAAGVESLDSVEQELTAALRAAADEVLGPANGTRKRLGWQAEHADTLKSMAEARRQLAARQDLRPAEWKDARRRLHAEQRRELRRLVTAWWDRRLEALHSGRGMPGRAAIEAVEREAGLGAPVRGRATAELLASDGTTLCGHEARLARWREHFASLFAEESTGDLAYIAAAVPQRAVRPEFDATPTRAEYADAVRSMKKGKAAGEDGVVAELLRAGGIAFHDRFFELVGAC